MIWPLAAEYAKLGWAVRRAGWANPVTSPFNASSSLRWVTYQNGLFHLTYIDQTSTATIGSVSRVVRNTDFGVSEFHANDWTVYSTSCQVSSGTQQGKLMYPVYVDDEPYSDPFSSLFNFSGCQDVPPIKPPGGGGGGGGSGDPPPPCGPCLPPPLCGTNFKLVETGIDKCNCRNYICQPTFCNLPPECPDGYRLQQTGYDDIGCPQWECREIEVDPCDLPPQCPEGTTLVLTGVDIKGCGIFECQPDPTGCENPTPLPNCFECCGGGTPYVIGFTPEGCAIYDCRLFPPPPPPEPPPEPPLPPDPPRPPRPRRPCNTPSIIIEGLTKSPSCFENEPYTAQYGFTVRLTESDECADSLWWVTIKIHNGITIRTTMSPGDADSYSVQVTQPLGSEVRVFVTAYNPILGRYIPSYHAIDTFPEACEECDSCESLQETFGATSFGYALTIDGLNRSGVLSGSECSASNSSTSLSVVGISVVKTNNVCMLLVNAQEIGTQCVTSLEGSVPLSANTTLPITISLTGTKNCDNPFDSNPPDNTPASGSITIS